MLIIGLTGGIASGKSAVAAELAELGAMVLNADEAAHRVINDPDIRQALVERWGTGILLAGGEVNRKAVAERVFSPSSSTDDDREFLENLLHPRIRHDFETVLKAFDEQGVFAAVIDAPLLLEAGWDAICQVIMFVDCPRETRLERATANRHWSAADFAAREAAQMPIEEKRRRATHILVNDGSLDNLRRQIRVFWQSLENPQKSS